MPRRDPGCLQLAARHLDILRQLLADHVPQAEVWAYGSRVTGGAHEGSDLDIVVRLAPDSATTEGLINLRLAVEESRLPMLVDIHDWARLPASFHANIEKDYVVLQEATDA